MTNADPIAVINNIVNQSQAASTTRWLVCPKCYDIEEHDMAKGVPAATCPKCNEKVTRVLRPSLPSAELAVTGLKSQAPIPSAPTPVERTVVEPKLVAEKQTDDNLNVKGPIPLTTGSMPLGPDAGIVDIRLPTEPTPITRTRKTKVRVEPVVSQPVPEVPNNLVEAAQPNRIADNPVFSDASGMPMPSPVEQVPVSDAANARNAATAALIAKHRLNNHTPARVCTGEVLTWGYTRWSEDSEGNRKPTYVIRDVADSGEYMKSLNEQRRIDGTTGTDVVVVTDLPAEVRATAWNGELIASTRDSVRTHRVTCGARVTLGAKVSAKGRLIWCVLGNA